MKFLIVMILCVGALVGCSTRIGDFTMLCPRSIDLEHSCYEVDESRRISGSDRVFVFVVIPFGLPDYETAVADACKGVPGCVGLSNVAVKYNYFWLGLGYSEIETVGSPILQKGDK